jgi:colanic acid biosynthesis glycosyl transferase WcaI
MTKPLRALVISHGFPPDMGGAANRAWNIGRAMQAGGHEVVVIAAYPYYPHGKVSRKYMGRLFAKEHFEGFEVVRVWIPSLRTEGYLRRLLIYLGFTFSYSMGLLVSNRPLDLVYYVSPYPLSLFSFPAILFGRLAGSRVFLDVADLWPEVILEVGTIRTPLANTLAKAMARVVSALSDLTTPITESIRERLLELGLSRSKLEVVELAIDTDYFRPQPPKFLDDRLRGKFVAEYSGIVGPKYDFASLIEAAKIIGQKNQQVLILIRGSGETLPYVKRSAASTKNVLVLDKMESADKVLDYLNAADVLLCPMRDLRETSTIVPSKVLEYFAVGKPVVCSGRGETEIVMNQYKPGIMVPPNDPQALAEAILRLKLDAQFYEASARNARALAIQRYSLPTLSYRIQTLAHRIEALTEGSS